MAKTTKGNASPSRKKRNHRSSSFRAMFRGIPAELAKEFHSATCKTLRNMDSMFPLSYMDLSKQRQYLRPETS